MSSSITSEENKQRLTLYRAFILLNIVRSLSILALAGADALLGFIIVNSFITHTFFFFDLVAYFNLFALTAFLILTELPQRILPSSIKCYLATHWPLLSYSAGLRTLAAIQASIGVIILGFINNKDATSRGTLGETCWRLMCSSGAFLIFMGVVNSCVSWVCMGLDDGGKILSARQIRDPERVKAETFSCLAPSFSSSSTSGGDVEKGHSLGPPIIRVPSSVYSQKTNNL